MLLRLATALVLISVSGAAEAQSGAEDFYRGKTVRILIGFGPGGSSSLYAEILARYIGRYIPGNPTVIGQHMPGAGGLAVVNQIASRSPRDGTEFAITSRNAAFEPLLGNVSAKFDPLALNWIGNANIETSVCVSWHTAPVKDADALLTQPFVGGGTGADSLEVSMPKVLNAVAGAQIKVVSGYPSSVDILLAMERGEVQGFCGIGWSYLKLRKADWLNERKVNVLFQMGLTKHPDLPGVPQAQDLASNESDKALIEVLLAPQDMGRPFFAPPAIPPDRLTALRDAFARTLADADFRRDADKAGLEIQYTSGEAVEALLRRFKDTPADVLKRASHILRGG